MSEPKKKAANVSTRVTDELKKRIQREVKRVKSRSESELVQTLLEEALTARESDAETPADTPAIDPGIGSKLDQLLHGLETAEAMTGSILDQHEAERQKVTEELRNLRDCVTLALVNILVQVSGVEPERARAAVHPAMAPRPPKPRT